MKAALVGELNYSATVVVANLSFISLTGLRSYLTFTAQILKLRMFSIGSLGYYYPMSLLSWQLGIGNKHDLQRHVT